MSSPISDHHPATVSEDATAPLGLAGLFGLAVFLVGLAAVTANLLLMPVLPA